MSRIIKAIKRWWKRPSWIILKQGDRYFPMRKTLFGYTRVADWADHSYSMDLSYRAEQDCHDYIRRCNDQ